MTFHIKCRLLNFTKKGMVYYLHFVQLHDIILFIIHNLFPVGPHFELRDDEFVSSLQVRLIFGVATLIVTITTMAAAFIATCFLIFNHTSTWVTFLVASFGFITLGFVCFVSLYSFRRLLVLLV